MRNKKKAIVLLSGGLDSATALYYAKSRGYDCKCLTFDYGQRHKKEIDSAKRIAKAADCTCRVVKFDLPWKGSVLLDPKVPLPRQSKVLGAKEENIPPTYVPARNTIFLSFAISYAETAGAEAVFIGANAIDFSGYPDCRPEYYGVFNKLIECGTKSAVEGKNIKIFTPLIGMTKAQIVKLGERLGVPYEHTWSCYSGGDVPCLECDSCVFRAKGFKGAGVSDPLLKNMQAVFEFPAAKITEVFLSIQGEGIYAGEPHIFVRFYGCNMQCEFCDTPQTGTPENLPLIKLIDKVSEADKYKEAVAVTITGGEPLLHSSFLKGMLPVLRRRGYKIHLDTNGTLPEELEKLIDMLDIIAMDVKLPSSTGYGDLWKKHLEFLKIAKAKEVFIKAVVTGRTQKTDIDKTIGLIETVDRRIPLILQPASEFGEFKAVADFDTLMGWQKRAQARLNDVRIIPQLHKVEGIR